MPSKARRSLTFQVEFRGPTGDLAKTVAHDSTSPGTVPQQVPPVVLDPGGFDHGGGCRVRREVRHVLRCLCGVVGVFGQSYGEGAAEVWFAVRVDGSAVVFHDAFDDSEPQSDSRYR